ncbi:hypothetical protein VTK73DRAFT_6487 [Phialemonium thermophilum]|uniref:Uncharacterized protein n=1 Tax=Phialemonium thermophilum TaxID=223376 RepID=A0ABR3WJA5_9PEZI
MAAEELDTQDNLINLQTDQNHPDGSELVHLTRRTLPSYVDMDHNQVPHGGENHDATDHPAPCGQDVRLRGFSAAAFVLLKLDCDEIPASVVCRLLDFKMVWWKVVLVILALSVPVAVVAAAGIFALVVALRSDDCPARQSGAWALSASRRTTGLLFLSMEDAKVEETYAKHSRAWLEMGWESMGPVSQETRLSSAQMMENYDRSSAFPLPLFQWHRVSHG